MPSSSSSSSTALFIDGTEADATGKKHTQEEWEKLVKGGKAQRTTVTQGGRTRVSYTSSGGSSLPPDPSAETA